MLHICRYTQQVACYSEKSMKKQSLGHHQMVKSFLQHRSLAVLIVSSIALAACGGDGGEVIAGGPVFTPSPAPNPAPAPIGQPNNCTIGYSVTQNPILAGTDPLFGNQWHLNNIGQNGGTPGEDVRATSAWATTKGAGVRVAVIDDAIETVHPDLEPNVVPGVSYNYISGSALPLPCTSDDIHGTQVAGLIAARDDNAIGVAGVAPRASLVGFNGLKSGRDADLMDALGRDNQNVAVSNNSWGSPDDGFRYASDTAFANALENGINNGRGGRGTVYVFPAGNGGFIKLSNDTSFAENSNFDGYVNRRGQVTVCATNINGTQPSFGERGANILVCAPGGGSASAGLSTTAVRGTYSNDFIGTSAATPVVAGVATLMLAANPNLTWRDVPLILAATARKNDNTDPSWTGSGGARFSHKYGFGVADANAAVNMARTWTSVGGSSSQRSCGLYTSNPGTLIPDASAGGATSTISNSISVPASCGISQIEFVEIYFSTSHTYPSELRLRLISPSGAVSELANEFSCGTNLPVASNPCLAPYDNWRFGSVRHLGENASGSWRFEVTDTANRDSGVFQSWSIRVYGR
jgi:proprotein convertase subtilisin/kexin type 2